MSPVKIVYNVDMQVQSRHPGSSIVGPDRDQRLGPRDYTWAYIYLVTGFNVHMGRPLIFAPEVEDRCHIDIILYFVAANIG